MLLTGLGNKTKTNNMIANINDTTTTTLAVFTKKLHHHPQQPQQLIIVPHYYVNARTDVRHAHNDRLAGVAALDALLTVPSANEERRAIRFGNNLSYSLKGGGCGGGGGGVKLLDP